VVILTALFALIRALTGLSFKRGWMEMDNRAGLFYNSAMDLQLLVGLILYFFLSPTTTLALQNFGAAMSNPQARFFGMEHVAGMFIAVVLAHIGRSLSRKAPTAAQKHRRALIWFAISLVVLLAAIPWPFLAYGRPLF
jgi:hypothetical protein